LPSEPIVLYSTSTWLAYAIAEQYYAGDHYVWCTPHFDPSSVPPISYSVPPSSSPLKFTEDSARTFWAVIATALRLQPTKPAFCAESKLEEQPEN
jgi:hypothetical protein